MNATFKDSNQLLKLLVKVDKKDSAYVYFTLEACDNLCFYSTLKHQVGDPTRVLEIFAPIEWEETLLNVLDSLKKRFPLDIQSSEIITDA